MTRTITKSLRRTAVALAPIALALAASGCDTVNPTPSSTPTPSPTSSPSPSPSPSPTPTPTPAARDVTPCVFQSIPAAGGARPADLILPDTVKLNLATASGYPNGRRLPDPVIDVILAVIFLDVNARTAAGLQQTALTFAQLPLNPAANDKAFLTTFPFLATPWGTNPIAATTGTSFSFRTDPASSYDRVDRAGQPAVATALIGSAMKNAYNDAGPAEDVNGVFVPEIVTQLTALHFGTSAANNGIADDLTAAGFTVCSRR